MGSFREAASQGKSLIRSVFGFFVECKEMMVVTPHSDPSQRDLGAFWVEEEVEDQVSPCHDDDVDGD